jgi:glycine/D-amino acid oxidase-like deaminating enzyme
MTESFDLAIVGGGMVGSAIAYGAAKAGARALLLDEGDTAMRAARGNFGLVWSSTKGGELPAYGVWSIEAARGWADFAEELAPHGGGDLGYRRSGGLIFCVGDQEFVERKEQLRRLHNLGGAPGSRMLDRKELQDLLPRAILGERVTGASHAPLDGHTNPLRLLRALHGGFHALGGTHAPGPSVNTITTDDGVFAIARTDRIFRAKRVVVAAGIHTTRLAAQLGLDVPVRPVRGQNMVSERLAPILPLPASALRQTLEGQIQIGVSYEEVGEDPGTTVAELARMAARACTILPMLRAARMVRAWGALRPMTPDGFPVYAESSTIRGAYVATCHSGVTLAPMHAGKLAHAILDGTLGPEFAPYSPGRFAASTRGATAHA